ncbi:LOW QUALITY PROTEIN: GDNF family receptor alpha-4 [Myotis myotis]|uniref:LOW QUALITY PROTEIN: GDNF family receptor alpha-4 n=1 Tax=Myotis myotis TaxID=51298 RepID=UPI001748F12E|nr:LOW QUALITY PROTEIN: GDNF family receptor alpha-4 [Myotis myotis]
MARCLGSVMLLLLLQLLLRSTTSSAARNRCVDAAEACTADARCQQLRTEYVAQCLGGGAGGLCPRARCRRALRRFFARGPPALTHALLFCPCADPVCAERRRQTFVPACAFSRPGQAPPSCLAPLDTCEHSRVCRCGRGRGRGRGRGLRAGPPFAHRFPPTAQTPPPGLPGLLRARPQCARRLPARSGLPLSARLRGPHRYTVRGPGRGRGSSGLPPPGWTDYCALGVPAGTAVTPNYVDNGSARVAPWCDCGASGNRREECEAFRELFTGNRCLDGAIQAFDSWQPPVLQAHPDSSQDLEHSRLQVSSTDGPLKGCSLLSISLSWLSRLCSD